MERYDASGFYVFGQIWTFRKKTLSKFWRNFLDSCKIWKVVVVLFLEVVNVKSFFGGNLDYPKIKKRNKVCSTVQNLYKNVKHWYFYAKLYSKIVYCC